MAGEIVHIEFPSQDADRAAAFWGGLFGWQFGESMSPDFVYRHHWRPGDVVMWDNRCALHYAVHDYGEETRMMSRITVAA